MKLTENQLDVLDTLRRITIGSGGVSAFTVANDLGYRQPSEVLRILKALEKKYLVMEWSDWTGVAVWTVSDLGLTALSVNGGQSDV